MDFFAEQRSAPVQIVLLALFFFAFGPLYLFECMVGASLTPLLLVLGMSAVGLAYYPKKSSVKVVLKKLN